MEPTFWHVHAHVKFDNLDHLHSDRLGGLCVIFILVFIIHLNLHTMLYFASNPNVLYLELSTNLLELSQCPYQGLLSVLKALRIHHANQTARWL